MTAGDRVNKAEAGVTVSKLEGAALMRKLEAAIESFATEQDRAHSLRRFCQGLCEEVSADFILHLTRAEYGIPSWFVEMEDPDHHDWGTPESGHVMVRIAGGPVIDWTRTQFDPYAPTPFVLTEGDLENDRETWPAVREHLKMDEYALKRFADTHLPGRGAMRGKSWWKMRLQEMETERLMLEAPPLFHEYAWERKVKRGRGGR